MSIKFVELIATEVLEIRIGIVGIVVRKIGTSNRIQQHITIRITAISVSDIIFVQCGWSIGRALVS